ncbi:MAG: hypothetical protein ACLQBB_04700 [Solirubrobacteraceae bacterium]
MTTPVPRSHAAVPNTPRDSAGTGAGDQDDHSSHSVPMVLLRYVLPAAVVIAGLVVMALGSEADLEGGGGIVSAGIAIFFINWLFRTGAAGDREREAEDRARQYFDEHGRWPD